MSMDAIKLIEDDDRGGNALSAGVGALIGSALGRRGLLGGAAGDHDCAGVIDTLNKIDTAQASSAIQNQAGFCGVKESVNGNTFQIINGMAQGFSGLNTAITGGNSQVINSLSQGFNGLNAAILSQGYEGRIATEGLSQKVAACCCSIEKAVGSEGAATRSLMLEIEARQQNAALCDAKARIASLESQNNLTASQAAQTQLIDSKMQHLANVVISHMEKK